MNKIRSKKLHVGKRGLFAVCVAFMLALMFSVTLFVPRHSASADSSSGGGSGYAHECDENCYRNIYYFTDCIESDLYLRGFDESLNNQGFLSEILNEYASYHNIVEPVNEYFHYYPLRNSDLYNSLLDLKSWYGFYEEWFNSISNSLVIVELCEPFPIIVNNSNTPQHYEITDVLNKWFEKLNQNNNCKIMFICGTEECVFEYSDGGLYECAFLKYVEVHLELDNFTYFSAYTDDAILNGNSVCNATFVMDKLICPKWVDLYTDMLTTHKYNFYSDVLVSTLQSGNAQPEHNIDIYNLGYNVCSYRFKEMLINNNIKLLRYDEPGLCYDLVSENYVPFDSFEALYSEYENDYYYLITSTFYGQQSEDLIYGSMNAVENLKVFIYITYENIPLPNSGDDVFLCGMTATQVCEFVAPYMHSFILREDYPTENECDGCCELKFRPPGSLTPIDYKGLFRRGMSASTAQQFFGSNGKS